MPRFDPGAPLRQDCCYRRFKKNLAAYRYTRHLQNAAVAGTSSLSPLMLPATASRRMSQDNVFYGKVTSTDLAGTMPPFGIQSGHRR
jgi:hypothetical protein